MLAGIAGLVLLADDDSGGSEETVAAPDVAERVDDLAERTLTNSLVKREAGLRLAYPDGWKRSERDGIVTLESPERCTVISLSAPVPAAQAKRLREDSIAALKRSFKKVQVRRGDPQEVGGAPTTGALVAVRTDEGNPVVVRVAVSRARKFAHLTQVVLRMPPCPDSDTQTGFILGSIEFTR